MGNVSLPIFPQERTVVVDHRRGVVVDAFLFHLEDGNDEGDVELAGEVLHQLDGGAVRDRLGEVVPAGGLLGAEIRSVENLLEAHDLPAGGRGLADVGHVLVHHGLLGGFERGIRRGGVGGLNQRTADDTRHESSLPPGYTSPFGLATGKAAMGPIMSLPEG